MTRLPGRYFDSELIARISRLELTAQRIVDGFLAGRNRSSRHGVSVEFAEHREYVPGDDLRHLDWKVLGRLDRFYVKRYEEETNITARIWVDVSASMTYGSTSEDGSVSKFDTAATLAASLAYLLHRQRDAVGLTLFDREVRAHERPSVKLVALSRLIAELRGARPAGPSALEGVLRQVAGEQPGRCLHVLISDLFLPPEDLQRGLRFLRYHGHDALVLQVLDSDETRFPFDSSTLFRSLEDDRQLLAEPRRLRSRYLSALQDFLTEVRRSCEACAFGYRRIESGEPLGPALAALLSARSRQRRFVTRPPGGRNG